MKKIFAIVGESNWGKSNTLYKLFNRKQFLPLNKPITIEGLPYKFVVINASNEDRPTKAYLERLEKVLDHHKEDNDVIFIITVSLAFKEDTHSVKPVLTYLNNLEDTFDVFYIVLSKGWKGGSLDHHSVSQLKALTKDENSVQDFDEHINMSKTNFDKRTEKILDLIKSLI